MNANELAEQLDEYAGNSGYSHNDYADSMSQAATMLRQQQAEIAQEKLYSSMKHDEVLALKAEIEAYRNAKIKDLGGVEIIGMSGKYDFNYEVDIIEFARAILRKAQEK